PISPTFPPDCPPHLRTTVFGGPLYTKFAPAMTEELLPAHVVPLGPNFAVRRSAIDGLRFDPALGPQGLSDYPIGCDVDFGLRVIARNHRCHYVPKAIIRHVVRPEQLAPEWIVRRCGLWGRGAARL